MADLMTLEVAKNIATLTMNRLETYNAFNQPFVEEMASVLTRLATDDGVGAVVLTGAGKAFCAGGDLKAIQGLSEGPRAAFHRLAARFHACVLEMRRMPKPVIAAINGVAAGGGFSLALAADFRIMAKSAFLKCAYLSNGLCIDGGGTWTLPRLVGAHRALEIAVLDDPIPAQRALELGLVTKLADDDKVLDEAQALAERLVQGSLHSFAWTKNLIQQSFQTPFEAQLEAERDGIATCGVHPDGLEGLAAFAAKRKPEFRRPENAG